MAEITKFYRQPMPAARFIGKRYTDADRKNGYFIDQWQQWITEGWFQPLGGFIKDWDFEGSDVPIGLFRHKEGEPAEYWIGRFFPPLRAVPEGYLSVDFPAGTLGVCWVRAHGLELYGQSALCLEELDRQNCEIVSDSGDAIWHFERYEFPRSRRPEADGSLTLDYCFYIGE